jgi:hypothetical protein
MKALNEKGAETTEAANKTEAAKADALRKTELSKHASDAAKAEAKNQGVQTDLTKDLTAQRKAGPIRQRLANAQSALRASVETAREKALKTGNEKYNAVNEKLNALPADMEKVMGAYGDALDSFGESQAVPSLLRRMEKGIKEPLTYKDLQSLYSDLGKKLSKGSLSGTTFHAYDVLQEAVGEDMQRIADSQNMGADLSAARNYWRLMKQTFGEPISFTDAATKAIGGVRDETQANQIRLLGAFDPSIPRQFAHVASIEKGVEALPNPVPKRMLTRDAAAKRVPAPKLEVTPLPTPKTFEPQKIGPEEVKGAHQKGMEARQKLIEHKVSWIGVGSLIYTAIDLLKGEPPNVMGVGATIGGSLTMQAAFTKIITSPEVVAFLEKATPADVAQIPPELRGNFPKILTEAQKRGIKISPALTAGFTTAALAGQQNDSKRTTSQISR